MKFNISLLGLLFVCIQLTAQTQMANFYFEKGKEAYNGKFYQEAIDQLEKALEKDAQHADALCYLGYAYYDTKEYDKVVEVYTLLQEASPDYWPWYIYLRANAKSTLASDQNEFLVIFSLKISLKINSL